MINLVKGDTINLGFVIKEPIVNWKIRCEIFDTHGHSVRIASANSGGTGSGTVGEIYLIDVTSGKFQIYAPKGLTTAFDEESQIEVEMETDIGDVYTLLQDQIIFSTEKITWQTP